MHSEWVRVRSDLRDWSPVDFVSDPTPGDPDAVAHLDRTLFTLAVSLDRQARTIDGVRDMVAAPVWSGLAAEVFADRLIEVADSARRAAHRHNEASNAARLWAGEMYEAQHRADEALEAAEEALEEIARVEAQAEALGAELALLQKALRAAQETARQSSAQDYLDDGREVTSLTRTQQSTQADLTLARNQLDDAHARLAEARRKAQRAEAEYSHGEGRFMRDLQATLHGALTPADLGTLSDFIAVGAALTGVAVSSGGGNRSSRKSDGDLMGLLTGLSPENLARLVALKPGILQKFWNEPPSPDTVAAWWGTLSDTTRADLIEAAPEVLGNLAGLPFAVRSACNLDVYEKARTNYAQLTPQQRKTLDQIAAALAEGYGDAYQASLVSFNLGAAVPMVAIGYGPLDTATNITWAAPGMNSDASDGTASWSAAVLRLLEKQNQLAGGPFGMVAWLGYDAPDELTVSQVGPARAGANRLANELDGTYATRAANTPTHMPFISVVAHSYGTTVATIALTKVTHPVDSLTMVGSAGIDTGMVGSLSDVKVKSVDGKPAIYTTSAERDYLAPFGAKLGGRANPNPRVAQDSHILGGAQSFSSEGGSFPGVGDLKQTQGHTVTGKGSVQSGFLGATAPEGHGYLDADTQSLRNSAATSLGRPDLVLGGLTATGDPSSRLPV